MYRCGTQKQCYQEALKIQSAANDRTLYSPQLFPFSGTTEYLNVTLMIVIYRLMSLTNDKTLSVAMELELEWIDPNYPANWTNMPDDVLLYTDCESVWTMNLNIMNPASPDFYLKPDSLVFLTKPAGGKEGSQINALIIGELKASCDSLDLKDYPFDSQNCSMIIQYGDQSRINFIIPQNVSIASEPSTMEWDLISVSTSTGPDLLDSYVGVTINFSLTRKSYYYVIFLLIPTALLQSTGVLIVLLPSDRGEKVVLGATIVVAMYILFATASEQIPQLQESHEPRLVTALEVGTFLTAFGLVEAVVVQTIRILAHDFALDFNKLLTLSCWQHSFFPTISLSRRAENSQKSKLNNLNHAEIGENHFAEIDSHGNSSIDGCLPLPMSLPALPSTQEGILVKQLLEKWQKKSKHAKSNNLWRRIELVINLISFIAYVATLVYFYAFYIQY